MWTYFCIRALPSLWRCYLYHTQSSLIDTSSFKSKISCSKGPYLIETLKIILIFLLLKILHSNNTVQIILLPSNIVLNNRQHQILVTPIKLLKLIICYSVFVCHVRGIPGLNFLQLSCFHSFLLKKFFFSVRNIVAYFPYFLL